MGTDEALKQWVSACEQEFAWKPGALEEMSVWQSEVRELMRRALGIDHLRAVQPSVTILESIHLETYRRDTMVFKSRPGCEVYAYLLVPKDVDRPRPGVVCLPGHGVGVDAIVGLVEEPYQADFALQCVRQGFVTLAIEQLGFGRRRSEDEYSSCHRDSTTALMLGETMTGWRVWDAMRAMDVLASLPEVDSQRLVTMGISGGGLTSLWTAALDERVWTAVVSGYFNTFRDSILSIHHCVDNYVPGILRLVEMPDFAALVAPRRLFVESGSRDDLFPIQAFRRACDHARSIYGAFGVPERFSSEEFEGEHQFNGKGAFWQIESLLRAERV